MLLILTVAQMWAQSDTVRIESQMVSDSAFMKNAAQDDTQYYARPGYGPYSRSTEPRAGLKPVSDSAVLDDATQDADQYYEEPLVYSKPQRNALAYFGSSFAEHFLDVKCMVGADDVGIGLNYTFIPEIWGFNLTAYDCFDSQWALAGFNYRLSKPWNRCDWQLYGDLGVGYYDNPYIGIGYTPAIEAGVRLSGSNGRHFGHYSGTIGVLTDMQRTYFTFGVSISLTFLASISLLFGIL